MARDHRAYLLSRRSFCWTLAVLLAAAGNVSAQASKVRRVGRLELGMPWTPEDVLEQAAPLRELGWVEGQNLQVE